jgi:energy-converting hydrogenase Eha subunit A
VVVGRERLVQIRNRLAFILMTTDMSERSQRELSAIFPCPQISALTSGDIERLFGFHNCKLLGFRRGDLANSALKALRALGANPITTGSEEEPTE